METTEYPLDWPLRSEQQQSIYPAARQEFGTPHVSQDTTVPGSSTCERTEYGIASASGRGEIEEEVVTEAQTDLYPQQPSVGQLAKVTTGSNAHGIRAFHRWHYPLPAKQNPPGAEQIAPDPPAKPHYRAPPSRRTVREASVPGEELQERLSWNTASSASNRSSTASNTNSEEVPIRRGRQLRASPNVSDLSLPRLSQEEDVGLKAHRKIDETWL